MVSTKSITLIQDKTHKYAGRPAQKQSITEQNVGQIERLVSVIGGGALCAYGITRLNWWGAGAALLGGGLLYRGTTGHSFAYQALRMNTAVHYSATVTEIPGKKGFRVQRSLTINRTPEDLYEFWFDVEKAPLYTPKIESVTKTGERTSHWIAKRAFGRSIEWDAELLEDLPGKRIAWHVHGKPTTANAGRIHFEAIPDRGSVVTLILDYTPSEAGFWNGFTGLSSKIAEHETLETLRRFKELMETGELPTTKGQPTGKGRK